MKKLILFALLLTLTAIGNTTFGATSSFSNKTSNKELMVIKENIKIDSRNSDSIDESTNSLVENVKKVSPLPWLCFVSEPREVYVSTSPDGWDYYDIVVDITCYHYTATRLVPMY